MAAAQITVKEELQELSQESLPSKLPSLPSKSGTSTKAAGTLDAPIDLTMDDIDDLEPRAAPEAPPISLASLDQSALLERTSSLDEPAHGGNSDGLRTDIDPIKPQREGAATMAIAGPSSSPEPAADDSADRDADNVKVESADDICLRSQSPISSENGLTLDHLDVIFHTESSVMFCRLCVYVCASPSPLKPIHALLSIILVYAKTKPHHRILEPRSPSILHAVGFSTIVNPTILLSPESSHL